MNNIVVFMEQLPVEKQAEGIAVCRAVLSGKCNSCDYLLRCCSDSTFKLPKDAFCTTEKENMNVRS